MKTCYFAQLFLLDEEQLNEFIKEQTKEKDSQLEIDFEKDNKESEIDAELSKMTKKELIEKYKYLSNINIQINKERKDIATQFKEFATEANKKADKLIIERNELLNKLSKANCYIDYLKSKISDLKNIIKFIENEFGIEIKIES